MLYVSERKREDLTRRQSSCVLLFWVILTIGIALSVVVPPTINGLPIYDRGQGYCYLRYSGGLEFIQLGIWLFLLPAFIIVFIGTLILRNRKTTTPELIRSNVKQTLAASALGFFLLMGNLTLDVLPSIIPIVPFTQSIYLIRTTLLLLYMIAFPLIWIVTWTKNEDISFPCCKGDVDEERQLLQPK